MTKFKSNRNLGLIRGSTTINHKKRVNLNISCDEYVMLDAIEQIQTKHKYFSSSLHRTDVYKLTGFVGPHYSKLGKALIDKGFLVPYNKKFTYKLSDKFGVSAEENEKEFDTLWKFLNKKGNRKSALEMFLRAKKAGTTYEHLMKQARIYKKYIEQSDTFQMHVSSWLNPVYEKYNDEYEIQSKAKDDTQEQSGYKGKF